jgi:hypothetical protein
VGDLRKMKLNGFSTWFRGFLSATLVVAVVINTVSAQCNSGFLDSLEDLLRNQSDLITSFEYFLHKAPETIEEKVQFLASFEDLLRRQAILLSNLEDILKKYWDCMGIEDQEKFLCSFEDLIERLSKLLFSFQDHLDDNWGNFNHDEKMKFLSSFEDLLRRQANLLKSYQELFKMKRGGISIEKSVDKSNIEKGETVTYSYVITNSYKNLDIKEIVIIDDKLGTIASNISLTSGETKTFTKSVDLIISTCNQAKVMGKNSKGDLECDKSSIVCVRVVRGGGINEPLQYSQYCEESKIEGEGIIDVSSSLIDRNIALEYQRNFDGDGYIKLDSENLLSEKASNLKRPVGNKTVPLNFYEDTAMEYSGSTPLTGGKSLNSNQFYGGIGADIDEYFSVNQLEKKQTSFFASTDPNTHTTNATEAAILKKESPVHLVGIDTKNSFNGTWGTGSVWHEMFKKDFRDHQLLTGIFETEKLIKFHKKPVFMPHEDVCEGIDC